MLEEVSVMRLLDNRCVGGIVKGRKKRAGRVLVVLLGEVKKSVRD